MPAVTCTKCGSKVKLADSDWVEGRSITCTACGTRFRLTFPTGDLRAVLNRLQGRADEAARDVSERLKK